MEAMSDRGRVDHRLQAEVLEIADVLAREQGKTVFEVWEEALSLHRVRYATEVLPPLEEPNTTRRKETQHE